MYRRVVVWCDSRERVAEEALRGDAGQEVRQEHRAHAAAHHERHAHAAAT